MLFYQGPSIKLTNLVKNIGNNTKKQCLQHTHHTNIFMIKLEWFL